MSINMIRHLKGANRWLETREKWVVPVVTTLLFCLLVIYVFNRDILDFGP